MEYYNKLSPFPVFDTESVEIISNKLEEMKDNTHIDYDAEPVTACKHCNSLAIVEDDYGNDICVDCSSCNELVIYDNIHKYLEVENNDVY